MLRGSVRATNAVSVNEIYTSIQGEGLLVGTPSIFLRLQGCNFRCPWCDQPEALEFKNNLTSIDTLLSRLKEFAPKHVVITGGEPLAQRHIHKLIALLLGNRYSVQIETNGTLWSIGMEEVAHEVHITCSPKAVANFFVHPQVLKYARELKFVVDSELKEEHLLKAEFIPFLETGRVTLQPEGNRETLFKKAIYIQERLMSKGYSVRLIPQTHKLIGLR